MSTTIGGMFLLVKLCWSHSLLLAHSLFLSLEKRLILPEALFMSLASSCLSLWLFWRSGTSATSITYTSTQISTPEQLTLDISSNPRNSLLYGIFLSQLWLMPATPISFASATLTRQPSINPKRKNQKKRRRKRKRMKKKRRRRMIKWRTRNKTTWWWSQKWLQSEDPSEVLPSNRGYL